MLVTNSAQPRVVGLNPTQDSYFFFEKRVLLNCLPLSCFITDTCCMGQQAC